MREIRILFEPIPNSPTLSFVEVENAIGDSISIGTWSVRKDGFHELRITSLGIENHPAVREAEAALAVEEEEKREEKIAEGQFGVGA